MILSKNFNGTQGEKKLVIATTVLGITFMSLLVFHEFPIFYEKPRAWILDRYSLVYSIFLIFVIPSIAWIVFLFWRYKFGTFQVLFKIAVKSTILLIILEVGGQVFAVFNPGYDVLWMYPHKRLGWTFPPSGEYLYTGRYWYAREFSGHNKVNSMGFRDAERPVVKDKDMVRIALIGDSMVSARQVSFDKTAGQLLEKRLNAELSPRTGKQNEVLNFGVDGYSTLQSAIAYWENAHPYKPDYTFYLHFHIHLSRTIETKSCWILNRYSKSIDIKDPCIFARPSASNLTKVLLPNWNTIWNTFHYENLYSFMEQLQQRTLEKEKHILPFEWNEYKNFIKEEALSITYKKIESLSKLLNYDLPLEFYEPIDNDKRAKFRNELIKKEFKGSFSQEHKKKIFILTMYKGWVYYLKKYQNQHQPEFSEVNNLLNFYLPDDIRRPEKGNENIMNFEYMLLVSLKIIGTLDNIIKKDNGEFILVDGITNLGKYYQRSGGAQYALEALSRIMKLFTSIRTMGYIPLSDRLDAASDQGIQTIFNYENHFTESGNRVFQEALFDYISRRETNLTSPDPTPII